MSESSKEKVAIIGGGVAGIVTAHYLQQDYEVTIFEKNDYLGGHTNTINVTADGRTYAVDTGFIVLNDQTYPNFHQFLKDLNVQWRYADMSFSFECEYSKLQYASRTVNTLFAQRKNLFSLSFWKMLLDITRFWKYAQQILDAPDEGLSLFDFLTRYNFSEEFKDNYILPISAAIWSSPDQGVLEMPAKFLFQFYKNHGMLGILNLPRWQTVVGGSQQYVKAFQKKFTGRICLNSAIDQVQRGEDVCRVIMADSSAEEFSQVVFAVHADQVLELLAKPGATEQELFSAWRYQDNYTVLHSDQSFLPECQLAHASWNYRRELTASGLDPVSVTYDMSRLQGLETKDAFLVTLNSQKEIRQESIIKEFSYHHPVFTEASVASVPGIKELQGTERSWYAGSYFGFGFHEDAVASAVEVVQQLLGRKQ